MSETIGRPVKRVDAQEKTGGYASYIADMRFDGMLYAKTLRSTRPRAEIASIDIPKLPKGYSLIDRHDVPGKNRVKMILDDQPFFAEGVVNYIGEPILLVVGPERETISGILSDIKVHYRDKKPILTIEEAMSENTEPLYGKNNCYGDYEIVKGNPDEAFKKAAEIVEKEYRTGYQEHIYLEPQGVIALYENGKVTVYGSMQCPYYVKNALIQGFGWEEERIRVVQTTTGGAFGGKEDYPSIIAGHAAFAAVKTERPVKLIFDREEDIRFTTKRHPSIIRFKTALNKKKRIVAMDVDARLDGGAYAGLSTVVLQRAMFAATGVYNIPDARVKGRVFATNNVPSGAFRGFGAPQAFFAIEMHMHDLAHMSGEDPLNFKLSHILKKGDSTVTGGTLKQEIKLPEMVDCILDMSGYREKYAAYWKKSPAYCSTSDFASRGSGEKYAAPKKRDTIKGIGLSLFYHGCAFTGSGEKDKIKARVKLKKRRDGKTEILVANVEMGQGAQTTLRKIVAKTLGLPIEDVVYENPDTDRVPDSGPTVASRTVIIVGFLLEKAAQELKEQWENSREREICKTYEEPKHTRWNQEKFEGDAYPVYSWGVNVAEVEVDPLTCEIKIEGVWGVYDVGTAIDERIIQGQIEGGIAQGVGYATVEVMETKDGAFQQGSMTDYSIPTSKEFRLIKSRLVENSYEYGPYGSKCAGELPFVGAAPAVASAVQNALRVPIERIPLTPEYLLEVQEGEDRFRSQR